MEFQVEGMSCGHCEKAVREAVEAVPGVQSVTRVDAASGALVVSGEPDAGAVAEAVREAGYDVTAPSS